MSDRVIKIFKDAGKPLMPKQAVEIYISHGWPRPENDRELYTAISSTMSYLTKRKSIMEKAPEGGYRLK
jgi:hypothetical protein